MNAQKKKDETAHFLWFIWAIQNRISNSEHLTHLMAMRRGSCASSPSYLMECAPTRPTPIESTMNAHTRTKKDWNELLRRQHFSLQLLETDPPHQRCQQLTIKKTKFSNDELIVVRGRVCANMSHSFYREYFRPHFATNESHLIRIMTSCNYIDESFRTIYLFKPIIRILWVQSFMFMLMFRGQIKNFSASFATFEIEA